MVNKLTPKTVVPELLAEFPELVSLIDSDEEEYYNMSRFADCIVNAVESGGDDERSLDPYFGFLNRMGESTNVEVQNILVVSVFEALVSNPGAIRVARQKLKPPTLEMLERTLAITDGRRRSWYD